MKFLSDVALSLSAFRIFSGGSGDSNSNVRTRMLSSSQQSCSLCEGGLNDMLWPISVINADGATCSSLALEMTLNYEADSQECTSNIAQWRDACCGNSPPPFVDFPLPSKGLESNTKIGPHPRCDICHDGQSPTVTDMVLTVRYVGTGSCAQFEQAGNRV